MIPVPTDKILVNFLLLVLRLNTLLMMQLVRFQMLLNRENSHMATPAIQLWMRQLDLAVLCINHMPDLLPPSPLQIFQYCSTSSETFSNDIISR